MHQIFSDAKSDTDLLNRQPFAAGIARTLFYALPEQNESFVFGLNGRWGSGKSTLLHFVKQEIERLHKEKENDRFEIFEFNPWMFSGQEQLQRVFLSELFIMLGGKKGKLKDFAKKASEFIKRYVPTKSILPDEWEESMDKILDALGKEDPLEDIKKAVDDLLVREKFHLYVIMDDIDRLTPEEITHVFQLVKLNANFKNTVFLLAYDKDVVVNAIEQKFKDNGERYLAKIVQIDYTLPEMLEEEVETIFFKQLDIFFKRQNIRYLNGDLKPYWSKYGLKSYFRTLRDVYRYINGLAFRLPEIYKEVNITHFLILEAFRVFDFEAYQQLYLECNDSLRRFQKFPDFEERKLNKYFSPTALELIRVLRQNPDSGYFKYEFERGRELFHSDYFERYFALRISQKDLPAQDFYRFLNNTDFGANWLSEVYKAGRFDNLLRRLSMPELEKEVSNVGVAPIRELIRFLDRRPRDHNYWISCHLLVSVVINILNINKYNKKEINQILDELAQECDYPKYTRFLVIEGLFEKLKNTGIVQFSSKILIEILQEKESHLKEMMRNFIHRNSDQFNLKTFITDESTFGFSFLKVYATFEPTIYPDFILKRFTTKEQITWLIKQAVKIDYEKKEYSWDTGILPLLMPQSVCDYVYNKLNTIYCEEKESENLHFNEQEMNVAPFFMKEYSPDMIRKNDVTW